jgi:hypothetical protein
MHNSNFIQMGALQNKQIEKKNKNKNFEPLPSIPPNSLYPMNSQYQTPSSLLLNLKQAHYGTEEQI